jgi:hypothetical protein
MTFLLDQPTERRENAAARDALSFENQRVQPVRQSGNSDGYENLTRKLNDKQSVREIFQAFAQG